MGLLWLDVRAPQTLEPAHTVAATILGPAERVVGTFARSASGRIRAVGGQSENVAALRRENATLRAQLQASRIDARLSRDLGRLLGSAARGRYRVVPARVIAFGADQGFARTVAIDRGERDGVQRDMTVVDATGLVGRVVAVAPSSATVLLAVDPTSTVGVRVVRTGDMGMLTGSGDRAPTLELLDPQAPVRAGDEIVTLGSAGGRPFTAGVPVGEVGQPVPVAAKPVRALTVRPSADYAALDVVGIVIEPPGTRPQPTVRPTGRGGGR
ncbi:rod shape-determining protein MreC [Kribbella sp. NPDC048915]|uniref:rod shape-determining protein MreC n=1 Tax=Kribbella sp. NPDC048915 TaxID=3155148 RepID=UPI0033D4A104